MPRHFLGSRTSHMDKMEATYPSTSGRSASDRLSRSVSLARWGTLVSRRRLGAAQARRMYPSLPLTQFARLGISPSACFRQLDRARFGESRGLRRNVGMPGLLSLGRKACLAVLNGRTSSLGDGRARSERADLSFEEAGRARSRRLLRAENAARREREPHPLGLDSGNSPGGRIQRGGLGWLHGLTSSSFVGSGWQFGDAFRPGSPIAPREVLEDFVRREPRALCLADSRTA